MPQQLQPAPKTANPAVSPAPRLEYTKLFRTCKIRPDRLGLVDALIARLLANRPRYEAVGTPLGTPWWVIATIHSLEASCSFTAHLHNGDPLHARTTHVPKGRPASGAPPFTWEVSARDALGEKPHSFGAWG